MYISELIAELEKIRETHGDLRVRANDECGSASTVHEADVFVHKNSLGETVVDFDV